MLEANTDRSYFMIGAVIIAAVLIAGAMYVFKTQLFAPLVTTAGADTILGTADDVVTGGGIVPRLVFSIFGKAGGAVNSVTP